MSGSFLVHLDIPFPMRVFSERAQIRGPRRSAMPIRRNRKRRNERRARALPPCGHSVYRHQVSGILCRSFREVSRE